MTGLKRGNWSTHELERLRSLYPRSSEEAVARLLHRSVPSVRRKARELFSGPIVLRPWTKDDDEQLREGFGVVDFSGLCLVLGRPGHDVSRRVHALRSNLRRGPWSREEINRLKRLFGSRRDEDLVVCLSRSAEDIAGRARALCLSKDKGFLARAEVEERQPMPRWDEDEVRLLKERYATMPNLHIARLLNRSVASVANKANQLGLRKGEIALREMGRRNVAGRYEDRYRVREIET